MSVYTKNTENKKHYDKSITRVLNFTDDSISNSNSYSPFNFPNSFLNEGKYNKLKTLNILKSSDLNQNNGLHKFTFKNGNINIKYSFSIPKKNTDNNKINPKYLNIQSNENHNKNLFNNNSRKEGRYNLQISSVNNNEQPSKEEENADEEFDENYGDKIDVEIEEGKSSIIQDSNKSIEKINIDNTDKFSTTKKINSNLSKKIFKN